MSKINEFLTEFADLLEKHEVQIEAQCEVGFMSSFIPPGESDVTQWFIVHHPELSMEINTKPYVDVVIDHNLIRKHVEIK